MVSRDLWTLYLYNFGRLIGFSLLIIKMTKKKGTDRNLFVYVYDKALITVYICIAAFVETWKKNDDYVRSCTGIGWGDTR